MNRKKVIWLVLFILFVVSKLSVLCVNLTMQRQPGSCTAIFKNQLSEEKKLKFSRRMLFQNKFAWVKDLMILTQNFILD